MDLDPAAVMAAHAEHIQLNGKCEHGWPKWRAFASDPHCEPYRLAEALAASEAKVARVGVLIAQIEYELGEGTTVTELRAAIA